MNSQSSGQPNKMMQTFFFRPRSPFPGNFCNCNSGGICPASQFKVQLPLLYTVWSNAYSEISPEVTLQLLAWKITKGIHSCKTASVNCPTENKVDGKYVKCFNLWHTNIVLLIVFFIYTFQNIKDGLDEKKIHEKKGMTMVSQVQSFRWRFLWC